MKRTILVFICTILTLSVFNTFAITPEEELLTRKEQKLKNYLTEIKAGDRTAKENILDEISKNFESEKYSEDDKKLIELVDFLMGEGSVRRQFEDGRLINDFPEIRRQSVKIMARIGGSDAKFSLLNALNTETHSSVKAEICLALAEPNMSDDSGDILRALSYMYRTTNRPDPNLVAALIEAVENIAKGNSMNYSEAIYLLSEIQHGNYNKEIRMRALKAIETLSD
ncbi:MAG: hypothetical protein J1G30_03460 [Spirochaetales bacterium]|nr:hypothetical protein [Spirochaetales bacterium]